MKKQLSLDRRRHDLRRPHSRFFRSSNSSAVFRSGDRRRVFRSGDRRRPRYRSYVSNSSAVSRSGVDATNSEYLQNLYDVIIPGAELNTQRKSLIKKVKRLIKSRYLLAKIKTYGSWNSNLSVISSDIDFSVKLPKEFNCAEHTCLQIAKALQHDAKSNRATGIFDVKVKVFAGGRHCIFGTDKDSKTNIDLTLNNRMAPMASKFIGSIVDIDLSIKMFLVLVKYFSKCHKLDDPGNGSLASIGFLYMGIYFLQRKNWLPKFLSRNTIRRLAELVDVVAEAGAFKVDFENMSKNPRTASIGELLREFFQYYSEEHNFNEYAISVLGGRLVRKRMLGWVSARYLLAIVDPFGDDNVGRSVRPTGLSKIKATFEMARDLILDGSRPQAMFKPFNTRK